MSQDDSPNLPNPSPAPPVDLDAELAAQARQVIPAGTGWRYQKSAYPYDMDGVMDDGCIQSRTLIKKYFMAKPPAPAPLPTRTQRSSTGRCFQKC